MCESFPVFFQDPTLSVPLNHGVIGSAIRGIHFSFVRLMWFLNNKSYIGLLLPLANNQHFPFYIVTDDVLDFILKPIKCKNDWSVFSVTLKSPDCLLSPFFNPYSFQATVDSTDFLKYIGQLLHVAWEAKRRARPQSICCPTFYCNSSWQKIKDFGSLTWILKEFMTAVIVPPLQGVKRPPLTQLLSL